MEFIMDYKWHLLIALETMAWLFTFLMFYARYWLESEKLFYLFTIIAVITGWFPHLTLMVMNIIENRSIGLFDVTIILLIIYGFTLGKKHIKSLDESIKSWSVNKKKETKKRG